MSACTPDDARNGTARRIDLELTGDAEDLTRAVAIRGLDHDYYPPAGSFLVAAVVVAACVIACTVGLLVGSGPIGMHIGVIAIGLPALAYHLWAWRYQRRALGA